jgi:IS1 family transposase/transposase-like protein
MTCHNCSAICKKFGKFGPQRIQRYRCNQCKKTFSEEHEKAPRKVTAEGPLGKMRISLDKAEMCLKLMLEGMSIRSIQRITGLHQETILNLLVLAGERCQKLMSRKIKGIAVKDVEADEIWGFVKFKNRHKLHKEITDPHVGDAYTWVGIERNTKLILAWHLGERDMVACEAFTEKLHEATSGHFQLTTDGFRPYENAVSYSLGTRVDYAMLIKVYATNREGEQKYSPPEVVETVTKPMIGYPDPNRICTSIVERSNLSMRTSIRRLTRLTNAFSKKWENLHAMLSLYFAFYNFCRIHSSIRCTPAMESRITGHVWTLRELLTA